MDDRHAKRLHERMRLVDIFARPRTETRLMQPDALLHEPLAFVLGRRLEISTPVRPPTQ